MHTLRKLPQASPKAKIANVIAGSTVCVCKPYVAGFIDYTWANRKNRRVRKTVYEWTPGRSKKGDTVGVVSPRPTQADSLLCLQRFDVRGEIANALLHFGAMPMAKTPEKLTPNGHLLGTVDRDIRLPFDGDRKSTRLNSSHVRHSYAVF